MQFESSFFILQLITGILAVVYSLYGLISGQCTGFEAFILYLLTLIMTNLVILVNHFEGKKKK